MIDKIYFERDSMALAPYEDYGILLKSFDAPPPSTKLYRVSLDGANGSLDLSEWAGEVKYDDRTVSVALLDMHSNHAGLVQWLTGRRCKIIKSDDPDFYYEGRCDSINAQTRKRVTNLTLTFTCSPWKLARIPTKIEQSVDTNTEIKLRALRKTVIPTVTLTAACTLTWNGASHALSAGTHTPAWFALTDEGGTLTVNGSGSITITWRDGVL